MTHKMTNKEKKQQKEIQYIDDKYNFMHSFAPVLTILEINYAMRNDDFNINRGGYYYNFNISRGFYAGTDSYDKIYVNRASLDINEVRKGSGIESCVLLKYKKQNERTLEFPLMLEKKIDIPLYDFGKYYMPSYNKTVLKPSYCYFCNKEYGTLRSHFKTKKHEKTKIKCVSDELINKLNKDCIMNICEYL